VENDWPPYRFTTSRAAVIGQQALGQTDSHQAKLTEYLARKVKLAAGIFFAKH